MKLPNNLVNKTPSGTYWRVQLVCKKIQANRFLEPPLEYNQDQMSLIFDKSRFIMTYSTILGATEILCNFRLVLEVKTSKEIPESSR